MFVLYFFYSYFLCMTSVRWSEDMMTWNFGDNPPWLKSKGIYSGPVCFWASTTHPAGATCFSLDIYRLNFTLVSRLHVRAISQAPSQLWGPQKDFSSLLAKSWGFWLTLSTISAFWHPVWFLVPSPTLPTTRDQRLDSEDQLPAGWLLEHLLAWASMSGLYLVALGPQGWQSLVPTRNHCWQIYLSSLLVKLGYFT